MSDLGSFSVQSAELREESTEWTRRKQHLQNAHDLANNGLYKGYKFGFFGIAAGLDDFHDEFISAIDTAFHDGLDTFDFIAASLVSTANAYDGADNTSAEGAESLRDRLPR